MSTWNNIKKYVNEIGNNFFYSTQINWMVRVDQDNGNGTALCYASCYGYLTLDTDKLIRK